MIPQNEFVFFLFFFFNMISWATGNNYNATQKKMHPESFSGILNVIEEGKRNLEIFWLSVFSFLFFSFLSVWAQTHTHKKTISPNLEICLPSPILFIF